jgi:hypothetical protein
MKKLILVATTASVLASLGGVASAQVTGTVQVTGQVTGKCVVIGGDGAVGSFSSVISLGELDQADGTLLPGLHGSTLGSPSGPVTLAQINCNSSAPTVAISATRLTDGVPEASANFSSSIDYTAAAIVGLAAGGATNVTYTTAAALPPATQKQLGGPLSNQPGDVEVEVFGLTPDHGLASFLTPGDYSAMVTVTITPT